MPSSDYNYLERRRGPRRPPPISNPSLTPASIINNSLIGNYHSSHGQPLVFHGNRAYAMGMELETHHGTRRNANEITRIMSYIINAYNEMYTVFGPEQYFDENVYRNDFCMEWDGSIEGIEFVFQPRDMESWDNYFRGNGLGLWLISQLNENGFHCRFSARDNLGSTGQHIHVTREWISTHEMITACRRITNEIPIGELLRITQRPSEGNLQRWAPREWTTSNVRYFVNNNPSATIEFRGFRSQLRVDRILAKLLFVYNLVDHVHDDPDITWNVLREDMMAIGPIRDLLMTPRPQEQRANP